MSSKSKKVLVSGSATIDMFADVESGSVKLEAGGFETDLICFTCGSKIQIGDLRVSVGGGGVNTAVDFARLKAKPMFLGKIGEGNNGARILKALKEEGVEVVSTKTSTMETGFSIIIKSADGDRTILTFKGANNDLKWSDFNKKKIKQAEWFYFASMVDESYKTLEKLTDYGKENNIKTLFNPSSYVVKKGLNYIRKLMHAADIFVVNMEEAQITLGLQPNYAQLPEHEVDEILRKLYSINEGIVVITNGSKRAYVYDGETKYSAMPYPAKVMDVAGAGDAFSSGFLTGYMHDEDVEHAMNTGLACAYSAVTSTGTWIQLRSLREAEHIASEFELKGHVIKKAR
jgi:ribokinase